MICIVPNCGAELWAESRRITDDAAQACGWRFSWDGKAPLLSTGAALCSACVAKGEERNFEPAKGRETT